MHTRHVIGWIDHEEEQEGEDIDPDQDGYGIEETANDIGDHRVTPLEKSSKRAKPAPSQQTIITIILTFNP
jgi:hypothetical protein